MAEQAGYYAIDAFVLCFSDIVQNKDEDSYVHLDDIGTQLL